MKRLTPHVIVVGDIKSAKDRGSHTKVGSLVPLCQLGRKLKHISGYSQKYYVEKEMGTSERALLFGSSGEQDLCVALSHFQNAPAKE